MRLSGTDDFVVVSGASADHTRVQDNRKRRPTERHTGKRLGHGPDPHRRSSPRRRRGGTPERLCKINLYTGRPRQDDNALASRSAYLVSVAVGFYRRIRRRRTAHLGGRQGNRGHRSHQPRQSTTPFANSPAFPAPPILIFAAPPAHSARRAATRTRPASRGYYEPVPPLPPKLTTSPVGVPMAVVAPAPLTCSRSRMHRGFRRNTRTGDPTFTVGPNPSHRSSHRRHEW